MVDFHNMLRLLRAADDAGIPRHGPCLTCKAPDSPRREREVEGKLVTFFECIECAYAELAS